MNDKCPKTISGKHEFTKKSHWTYPECRYCGLVDDTVNEENPIKIKRNKAEEERILGGKKKV